MTRPVDRSQLRSTGAPSSFVASGGSWMSWPRIQPGRPTGVLRTISVRLPKCGGIETIRQGNELVRGGEEGYVQRLVGKGNRYEHKHVPSSTHITSPGKHSSLKEKMKRRDKDLNDKPSWHDRPSTSTAHTPSFCSACRHETLRNQHRPKTPGRSSSSPSAAEGSFPEPVSGYGSLSKGL